MHHPDIREVAVSAVAIAQGFGEIPDLDNWSGGMVELYDYFAQVGELSAAVFDELKDPACGVPGVWAYEVDEECGAWMAAHFRQHGAPPPLEDCRAKLVEFARKMIARGES